MEKIETSMCAEDYELEMRKVQALEKIANVLEHWQKLCKEAESVPN